MASVQTAPLVLRYLFGALFADGSQYFQSEDDASETQPDRRSSFYDLCEHSALGESLQWLDGQSLARRDIELFQLEGQGFRYLVDLRDGHFEIQSGRKPGAAFFIKEPPEGSKLHLLYYRVRRHHIQGDREIAQECEYHFGWRAEVNGSVMDCTIFVI